MTASRAVDRGVPAAWLAAAPRAEVGGLAVRAAGTAAATAAAGCGGVIAARRLAGAIDPAGPLLLLMATTAGVALVLAADAARRAGGPRGAALAARAGLGLAVAGLATPPWAAGPADWIALAVAAVGAAATACRLPGRGANGRLAPESTTERRPEVRRGGPPRRRRPRREPDPGVLWQRFERRELPAGGERVRGRVVVVVPTGAKAGYGHLGFCPAFAATPTVEATTAYDGVEATVTAAEVLPWGVRVECRLAEPAEEQVQIPVDLVAVAAETP